MKRWLKLALQLLSLVLFGAILWLGGPQAWRQVVQGDARFILISFLLIGSATMLSANRLRLIARAVAGRELAPWQRFYHLNMTARALGLVVPRGLSTVAGKSVAIHALGVSLKRSIWIVLTDSFFDLSLLGALVLPALWFLKGGVAPLGFIALALGTILALAGGLWWATATGRLRSLARGLRHIPWLASALHLDREVTADLLLPHSTTLQALGLSVLLNSALVACFYYTARAIGLPYPWHLFAASFPATQLSLVLAVTPGGLGLIDAGWYGLLLLGGVPRQEALTFVIAQRAYVFVFVLVWAGISTLLSLALGRKNRDEDPSY